MEHKFTIEVRLKHEPPTGQPPKGAAVNVDPKVIAALLPQLATILTNLQPQVNPTGHPPKPTGHPPRQ